jgi:chromosome segregation ATPase
MAMKLLKKNEAVVLKAKERQIEIEQGKQLAERVDNLRRIAAEEEASLKNFRERSVAELHDSIKELTAKRDSLVAQLKSIEEDPDTAEKLVNSLIEKLKKQLAKADAREKQLEAKMRGLEKKEERLALTMKEAEENKRQTASRLKSITKDYEHSTNLRKEAQRIYVQAEIEKRSFEELKRETSFEFLRREANILEREKSVEMQRKHIALQYTDLHERERALADKYKALEQAQKHIKNKK